MQGQILYFGPLDYSELAWKIKPLIHTSAKMHKHTSRIIYTVK